MKLVRDCLSLVLSADAQSGGAGQQGNGNREADGPKVTEGWDSQGVLPGVGHPWLEVTFLGSRGRLHSLPQADGSLESLVLGPDNCVPLGKLWNFCVPLLPHLLTENSRSGVVVENWVGGL